MLSAGVKYYRIRDTKRQGALQAEAMTHASLFSGVGGFDLAAEWARITADIRDDQRLR